MSARSASSPAAVSDGSRSAKTRKATRKRVYDPLTAMTWIPGGTFLMGSADFYPEERPVHRVSVDGFWMDHHPVTVTEFRRFVTATGYVTVAERPLAAADYPDADPDLLVPGSLVFQPHTWPGRPARLPQLVGVRPGRLLAAPRGTGQRLPRPRTAPGDPGRRRRRRSLRRVGRQTDAHRGRMGVRGPRRPRPRGRTRGAMSSRRAAG